MNWDDLKVLIALHRQGSIAGAARELGQDETTIARRMRRLEEVLATQLLRRSDGGRQRLTDLGQKLVEHALRIETATRDISELAGAGQDLVMGTVRITAVPVVVDHILVPAFSTFEREHPNLRVEMIPEGRNLSLTQREADLAIRLGPPKSGGTETLSKRIGWLEFGLFRSTQAPTLDQPEWVLYEPAHTHLDQARWMQAIANSSSGLRVADLNTAIEAVASGLGQSLLPVAACAGDVRLQRVDTRFDQPFPTRPVWLLSHRDQSHLRSIQAVKKWLTGINWSGDAPLPAKPDQS